FRFQVSGPSHLPLDTNHCSCHLTVTGDLSVKSILVSEGILTCGPRVTACTPAPVAAPAPAPMAAPLPPPAMAPIRVPSTAPPPTVSAVRLPRDAPFKV